MSLTITLMCVLYLSSLLPNLIRMKVGECIFMLLLAVPFLLQKHLFAKKRGHHYSYYPALAHHHHCQMWFRVNQKKMVDNRANHHRLFKHTYSRFYKHVMTTFQPSFSAHQIFKKEASSPLPLSTLVCMVFLLTNQAYTAKSVKIKTYFLKIGYVLFLYKKSVRIRIVPTFFEYFLLSLLWIRPPKQI